MNISDFLYNVAEVFRIHVQEQIAVLEGLWKILFIVYNFLFIVYNFLYFIGKLFFIVIAPAEIQRLVQVRSLVSKEFE